jgi:hypothetical protein
MFKLSAEELAVLRSQFATLNALRAAAGGYTFVKEPSFCSQARPCQGICIQAEHLRHFMPLSWPHISRNPVALPFPYSDRMGVPK